MHVYAKCLSIQRYVNPNLLGLPSDCNNVFCFHFSPFRVLCYVQEGDAMRHWAINQLTVVAGYTVTSTD